MYSLKCHLMVMIYADLVSALFSSFLLVNSLFLLLLFLATI